MIIASTNTVPGKTISGVLGIVRGNVVGSKPVSESFLQNIKEAMLSAVALAPRIITGEEVGVVPKEEEAPVKSEEKCEMPEAAANELEDYSCLLTRLRDTALSRMIDNAKDRGADAVIEVRFDVSVISSRVVEVCAYGTAVKLS